MFDDLIAPLYSTLGRRIGLSAMLLFAIFVIFTLVNMPFHWYHDFKLTHEEHKPIVNMNLSPDKSIQWVQQIPEMHLFGKAPDKNNTDLPVTSLQLQLIGVMVANPENLSRIILSEAGQSGKSYRVGDVVKGVRVNAITSDGVILENNGRLEKLPLQREILAFQGNLKKMLE